MLVLVACHHPMQGGGDAGDDGAPGDDTPGANVKLPPVNAKFDYQLGGPYTPPSGVTVVSRDHNVQRALDIYNICYVNGFQIQPEEETFWLTQHPDLILRDAAGNPVRDPVWNEILVDTRLAEQRAAIGSLVSANFVQCASSGYDAIEIDNLDSYARSQGLLNENQAVLQMQIFSAAAHKLDKAIAQKNASEIVFRHAEMGTDFAIVEECNRYNECNVYTGGYGDHVIVIEYRRQDFTAGCTNFPNLSIVLRDVNLVPSGSTGYVYDGC